MDKAIKMRDLLNNLADFCVDDDDMESLIIRASLGLALQGLEDFIYDGKQTPSVFPVIGVSDKKKSELFGPSVISGDLTPDEIEQVKLGKKISAIKLVRTRTGMGLKEAKEYVEEYMMRHGFMTPRLQHVPHDPNLPLTTSEICLIEADRKIAAIKELRARTLWSLAEAKDRVDKWVDDKVTRNVPF